MEEGGRTAGAGADLVHSALMGRLVRPPANEVRAVAESVLGHVIIFYFDHQPGVERQPFRPTLAAQSAWATGRGAIEAGRRDQSFQSFGERRLGISGDGRGETHVVKQTMVIETEKERSNRRRMLAVAEASDDTVGGSDPFPLYRPV